MISTPPADPIPSATAFLKGGGEMGALIRATDWSKTALGPIETWSPALRTVISVVLNAQLPMYVAWGDDYIQLYNDVYRPILGDKHPAALGRSTRETFAEIWNWVEPIFGGVMQGTPFGAEDMPMTLFRNGRWEECHFTFSYTPVRDETGQVGGILVPVTETTEQVRARQRHEANWRQLLASFEQAPVAIALLSGPALTFRMANPFYAELVGRRPEQLIDKPLLDALPEIAGQGFDQLLKRVMATNEPYVANEVAVDLVRNEQLETLYVDLTYQPLREGDSAVTGVLVVATDVTEQVRARHQLTASEQQFRQLADSMPQMVWATLPDGHHYYYNQRWYDYTGLDYEQSKAVGWSTVLHPADHERAWGVWRNALRTGQTYQIEYRMREHTGQYRWFLGRAEPIRDDAGHITHWFGTCTDINEQKHLAEHLEEVVHERTSELLTVNAALERSNLDLRQFAQVASHDLKEPLRKIQLFGDMLQNSLAQRFTTEETNHLQRIIDASARMQTLVKEVLNLSSLSTQDFAFVPVDLNYVVAAIVDDLDVSIREAGANVQIGPLPTVRAVGGQMHQLFQNLISNALKFNRSDQPTVLITTEAVSAALAAELGIDPVHYVVIAVQDNGIGFRPEQRDKIFGMFQRLHTRKQYVGTGMGLTICRKIAENHQGFVVAEGAEGAGATFRVVLPA